MNKRLKRNKIIISIAFVLFIAGIAFLSYDYIISKIRHTFESVNLELYGNQEPDIVNNNSEQENEILTSNNETYQNNNSTYYFGYLEIPKINLKKGLVPLDSKYNSVDYNVQTIYPSDYPDVENGNLILAAHSGSSSISFFNHLYKLNKDDEVYIYYNNEKYIYKIVKIYTAPKNGSITIYRDNNKTTLTLITCTRNDKKTQTVYINELVRKEAM